MSSSAHETRLVKVLRTVLSFLLAGVISVLCVSICFNVYFLKASAIEKRLTCYEYTVGVQNSVTEYTESVYDRNGLEKDNISSIITYDAVKEAVDNYAGRYISARVGYEDDAYKKSISAICDEIKKDISSQIRATGQAENDDALAVIVKSINDYFVSEIDIPGVSKLGTVFNIGVPASYAAIGISAFFFIFITLILLFIGERRHRSLRAVSISFLTAGLFEICLSIIVYIISRVKTFDIYPIYLSEQFMRCVDNGIGIVAAFGASMLVLSAAISVLVWIKKNK